MTSCSGINKTLLFYGRGRGAKDRGTEGPERGVKARRARAPGEGARGEGRPQSRPPQCGVWMQFGILFGNFTRKSAHFGAFWCHLRVPEKILLLQHFTGGGEWTPSMTCTVAYCSNSAFYPLWSVT